MIIQSWRATVEEMGAAPPPHPTPRYFFSRVSPSCFMIAFS
jgi:hypothetical protein